MTPLQERLDVISADDACHHSSGCITCADEGVPMRVVSAPTPDGVVWCVAMSTAGNADDQARQEVMIGVVTPVAIGDTLLVHAGTALLRLPSPLDLPSSSPTL